ncbi:MAG: adenine-specific methyltransferase EcoRI family protein [Bacteroidaceae bacterium]|nr:adenine-specific methyltransferase EcoRI family protein [Bacteroidaceae bacterium]
MGNNNVNLQSAKNLKDDEFYTTYESIVEELAHYALHFRGKTVLCNCDDPYESNFCKYFLRNFNTLGLTRLICTSYHASKVIATQMNLFDVEEEILHKGQGYVIDVSYIADGTEEFSDTFINQWLRATKPIRKLKGDGDFRSRESIGYLTQSDIVVTNPPFSLFKEMISLLVKHDKKYLLIGNQNALTYREIFPLIQNNLAWTGYRFGDMKFRVPATSAPRKTRYWVDDSGQKWRSLGNAMWLTNLDSEKKHKWLMLTKRYSADVYPTYDEYDAINVERVQDIPMDYPGIMGVPITIINKYNPEQFEIVGEANHGSDNEYDLFKPTVNGKLLFKRILIRNKCPIGFNQDGI